jgi:hypothetical protein
MDLTSSPQPRHLRVVPDVSDPPTVLVANFVYAVIRKLSRGGSPEDQLRGPLEILIEQTGRRYGLDAVPSGEVGLKELRARPDHAVDIGRSRVGYLELEHLGRGIPLDWRPNKHTLRQVIGTTDWSSLMQDGGTNIYVELYENFLGWYDPGKQKESDSYYTSEPVAAFMVQFVDEMLSACLSRPWGFADDGVAVLASAMRTGMFLVEVMKRVAGTVTVPEGNRDGYLSLWQPPDESAQQGACLRPRGPRLRHACPQPEGRAS